MKTKKKTPFKKLPLLYGEKSPFCSGVFQNSLHLVYISFHHSKKIPLYNTEKNSSFVDVFLEKIFDLVLKITHLLLYQETYILENSTKVTALLSTDNGVAFIVKTSEGVIYHAGDLNDWYWEGEPKLTTAT